MSLDFEKGLHIWQLTLSDWYLLIKILNQNKIKYLHITKSFRNRTQKMKHDNLHFVMFLHH